MNHRYGEMLCGNRVHRLFTYGTRTSRRYRLLRNAGPEISPALPPHLSRHASRGYRKPHHPDIPSNHWILIATAPSHAPTSVHNTMLAGLTASPRPRTPTATETYTQVHPDTPNTPARALTTGDSQSSDTSQRPSRASTYREHEGRAVSTHRRSDGRSRRTHVTEQAHVQSNTTLPSARAPGSDKQAGRLQALPSAPDSKAKSLQHVISPPLF